MLAAGVVGLALVAQAQPVDDAPRKRVGLVLGGGGARGGSTSAWLEVLERLRACRSTASLARAWAASSPGPMRAQG